MMTKRFSALILIIFLCGFGLCSPLFCEDGKWVIASQKFDIDTGTEKSSVNDKTAELIPSDILEKLGYALVRNILPDEQFERTKYKLKTERQSLFLQLSAEYKKRDSLVLSNYSDLKLKSALKDSKKKIKELEKKIDKNLEDVKKAYDDKEKNMASVTTENPDKNEDTEIDRIKSFITNFFDEDETLVTQEEIAFYKDDYSILFKPADNLIEKKVTDPLFEKNVVSSGINCLITGHFAKYGDYISVYVDVYSYPGAKKIGSASEVGTVQELELISNSIAMQIVPALANSFPVQLEVVMNPAEAAKDAKIYIDDDLQNFDEGKIIISSGIHNIQFVSDGYKTTGTNYAFEGNKKYRIEVNFEKPKSGYLQVELKKPLEGNLLMNGERPLVINEKKSQIEINGKPILGEFISENGETAFFYVPERLSFDGSMVKINPKPKDRMAYIDKRRKSMYMAYSIFMISIIPNLYTLANFQSNATLYYNDLTDYETAKKWQTATNVTRAITIGCGVIWGIELIRYLIAANSVLPQNARAGNLSEFEFADPVIISSQKAAADNADAADDKTETNDKNENIQTVIKEKNE